MKAFWKHFKYWAGYSLMSLLLLDLIFTLTQLIIQPASDEVRQMLLVVELTFSPLIGAAVALIRHTCEVNYRG